MRARALPAVRGIGRRGNRRAKARRPRAPPRRSKQSQCRARPCVAISQSSLLFWLRQTARVIAGTRASVQCGCLRIDTLRRGGEPREARLQVGLQVVDVLQADVEPHRRALRASTRSPSGPWPHRRAAPGSRSRPTRRRCRTAPARPASPPAAAFAHGLSTTENRPQAPRKSRFQSSCCGWLGSAGWSTRATSGRCLQPARDLDARAPVPLQPHLDACAGRAGRGTSPRCRRRCPCRLPRRPACAPARSVDGDGAQHGVGVADDVLGAGLDRDVDAVRERLEVERARPGVVHRHQRAAPRAPPRRWPGCPAPRR